MFHSVETILSVEFTIYLSAWHQTQMSSPATHWGRVLREIESINWEKYSWKNIRNTCYVEKWDQDGESWRGGGGMLIREYWTRRTKGAKCDYHLQCGHQSTLYSHLCEDWGLLIRSLGKDRDRDINDCSHQRQIQHRRQRLRWHTPLHRQHC